MRTITGGGSNRFLIPLLATATLTFSLLFFFFYFRRNELPTSGNLLLALGFIAAGVFIARKRKGFVVKSSSFLKQLWDERNRNRKLGFSKSSGESVQWFIGSGGSSSSPSNSNYSSWGFDREQKEKKIIREGVKFYSHGDFYEGEFH